MAQQTTNADILAEIRTMNTRLTALETWKIAEDAARKAVTDYKRDEYREQTQQTWMDILRKLSPFLVALTALAYALIQGMKK